MKPSHIIAKNTVWLTVQPILLNIFSLFVIGYIARSLGEANYGKFSFAFAYPFLFSLIADLGINSYLTREIASQKDNVVELTSKILIFRVGMALLAYLLLILSVVLLGLPVLTQIAIFLAGLTLIFSAVTNTLNAVIQGFEKMEYVALSQFYSGVFLTFFSVVVLFIGFRLIGLTTVYVAGNFLWMVFTIFYFLKLSRLRFVKIDINFIGFILKKGFPFFLPAICLILSTKVGIICLASFVGDISVGYYNAVNSLLEKFIIIPDAVCTAIFPTLSWLHSKKLDEVSILARKTFLYLCLLGIPLSVGIFSLAAKIVLFVYGKEYLAAVPILKILVFSLLFTFFTSLEIRILTVLRMEKNSSIVFFVTTLTYLILCFLFIPRYGMESLAIITVGINLLNFFSFYYLLFKTGNGFFIFDKRIFGILVASFVMFGFTFLFRNFNLLFLISLSIFVYIFFVFALKVINLNELRSLVSVLRKKPQFAE